MKKLSVRLRWLLGISLAALFVVACVPATQFYVAQAVEYDLLGPQYAGRADYTLKAVSYIRAHRADHTVQIADLMIPWENQTDHWEPSENVKMADESGIFTAGDKLIAEFPSDPAVYANVLRAESDTIGAFEWQAGEQIEYHRKDPRNLPLPSGLHLIHLRDFIAQSKAAERLDPQNAYFTLMLSSAYYAVHEDDKAQSELLAHAQDTGWNDYTSAEAAGKRKITDATSTLTKGLDGYEKFDILESIPTPELVSIRGVARIASWEAVELEINGKVDQGVRLRHAIIHYGALARCYGTAMASNVLGMRMWAIATSVPDGMRPLVTNKKLPPDRQNDDIVSRRENAYLHFLTTRGKTAEAMWVAKEFAAVNNLRHAPNPDTESKVTVKNIDADMVAKICAVVLCAWTVMTCCLLGMISSAMGLFRLIRARKFTYRMVGSCVVFFDALGLLCAALVNAVSMGSFMEVFSASAFLTHKDVITAYLVSAIVFIAPFVVFILASIFIARIRSKSILKSLVSNFMTAVVPAISVFLLLFTVSVCGRIITDRPLQQYATMWQKIGQWQYVYQKHGLAWPALAKEPGRP